MAKLDRKGFTEWFAIACRWVDAALVQGDSLFTPGTNIWTLANLNDLHHRLIDNADYGDFDFWTKLEKQLKDGNSEVIQLTAELLYIYYLPMVGNLKITTKIEAIEWVLNLSPKPIEFKEDLKHGFEVGIARESQHYIQQRYYHLKFYLESLRDWWNLDADSKSRFLKDPWLFKGFLASIPAYNNNAARQMLLYLVHSDHFEPIMADSDKQLIATELANADELKINDEDQRILAIRKRLTETRNEGFSFYETDLKKCWKPDVADEMPEAIPVVTVESLTPSQRIWKIAPGPQGKLWDQCFADKNIRLGWNQLGNLKGIDKEAFTEMLPKHMAKFNFKKGCRVAWTFANKIKNDDIIIANKGTSEVLGIGKVIGGYEYKPSSEYAHQITVDWFDVRRRSVNFPHWVGALLKVSKDDYQKILDAPTTNVIPVVDQLEKEETSTPLHPVVSLLLQRLNVILYGPPGTGKTFTSHQVVGYWKQWQGANSVYQVTFHPSYSYEDFIEGFRPNEKGQFVLKPGIFRSICEAAVLNPKTKYLLVIDELNRGDVARIFGELITLIEYDKRDTIANAILPYSGKQLHVPKNLYILGTMNTADRSISLLDIAIRRRFCFVEFQPDGSIIDNSNIHHKSLGDIKLSLVMNAINTELQKIGIDHDRAVGHSHFMIPIESSNPMEVLRSRIKHDIIPLVEEYCYANRANISKVLGSLVNADGRTNHSVIDDDDHLRKVLTQICGQ